MDEELSAKTSILGKYISEAHRIVFFGGAGVSTESGIPDFRSAQGIYVLNRSAEEIVSACFFAADPQAFYDFYRSKMVFPDAKPNACHLALAALERQGKNITIVTQNIDGLHQLAGSKKVIELHGSVHRNHCLRCGKSFSAEYVMAQKGLPRCDSCHGLIKPDVVLYGESLNPADIENAIEAISEADLMIVAGTSLKVYPAASFIGYFRGDRKAYIDLSGEPLSGYLNIRAKIGEVFSGLGIL